MVVILKPNPEAAQLRSLMTWLESKGVSVHRTIGENRTILGLVGDTSKIDIDLISALDIVEVVRRVQEPYKNANRKFHPEDTVIPLGGTSIGGGRFSVIAGSEAVESRDQIVSLALELKDAGADMLWGGAFKARSSPYTFQGLGADGLKYLSEAKRLSGLPAAAEITDISQLGLFEDIDVILVGARNMQNFEMLKALGHCDKPILLKRALSSTYEDLLMSAEYIMSEGNDKVILCERGIKTFENEVDSTLDITAVPFLKSRTHLPVIADPSHSSGRWALVEPLSLAAAAAGADGVMIQVHSDPAHAMCGGPLSVKSEVFRGIVKKLRAVHACLGA